MLLLWYVLGVVSAAAISFCVLWIRAEETCVGLRRSRDKYIDDLVEAWTEIRVLKSGEMENYGLRPIPNNLLGGDDWP